MLEELKDLISSGFFHHATYRCHGTLWEGLWIYKKDISGYRGFSPSGIVFYKSDPLLSCAEKLVAHTGISVGSYGHG